MPVKQQSQVSKIREEHFEHPEHTDQVYCILCNQTILVTLDRHHSCSVRKNNENEKVIVSRV